MKTEIKIFYNLDAWKKGHQLVLKVYKMTKDFPKEEQFGIISQLRRAASSVTANIAEGFARFHFKDKIRFYYQSRGSIAEVQNFLILAKDLEFIDVKKCRDLCYQFSDVAKLVNGLIRSAEKQNNS